MLDHLKTIQPFRRGARCDRDRIATVAASVAWGMRQARSQRLGEQLYPLYFPEFFEKPSETEFDDSPDPEDQAEDVKTWRQEQDSEDEEDDKE